jgi:two-component system sensor histidine kinase VanS
MLANVGDYSDHPKYLRECLKLMDSQSKMVSEILDIVNLNDGEITPKPERLDIARVVSALLPSFRTLTEANGQRITVNIPENQTCFADSKMLGKALSNVILNAVQNTPSGGEIRIWSETNADQCRLCVLNTGARIVNDVLPKLFDPFYRMDKARSRKNGHSGLGLTIVKKTLEAMGAEFSLENTGEGVLFWMDLPEI